MSLRAVFIGLGLIGSRRWAIARAEGHEAVAAVDPDPRRWATLDAPGCRFASSLGEIGTPEADVAFIAVPHHLAYGAASWALDHGMHVLCEKPFGINVDEARRLSALAQAQKRKLAVGFNYRFLPGVVWLRDAIQSEMFGQRFRVRMLLAHGGRPGMESEWKLRRATAGGGALMDPGIHLLDLVRFLFGEPRVSGGGLRSCFWQTDVEDNVQIELEEGEAKISVEVSLTSWQNAFVIEVSGSDAMAVVRGRGGNYGRQQVEFVNRWFWQPGQDRRQRLDFGDVDRSFEIETTHFLNWASGASCPDGLATAADGLAAAMLVAELYQRLRPEVSI